MTLTLTVASPSTLPLTGGSPFPVAVRDMQLNMGDWPDALTKYKPG